MNRNALPFTAFDHLPVKFSYDVDPKTGEVSLIIRAPKEVAPLVLDGLQVMTQIAQQTRRYLEMAERQQRTEALLREMREKEQQIQAAYWQLRDKGLKFRQAVRQIVADPTMPFHYQWTSAEYGKCVKSAPRPAPVLRQVPKQNQIT